MRERNLLYLFLILNVALAGAFGVYLFLSSSRQPKVVSTRFPVAPSSMTNLTTNAAVASPARTNVAKTNVAATLPGQTNAVAAAEPGKPKPAFTSRKFGWQEVESDQYLTYMVSLRAVGCPEEKIRQIVLADINGLFDKRRVEEAVTHDQEWWRAESQPLIANVLQEKGRALEDQRKALIEKLLGPEAVEQEKGETLLWSSVQLTGPVLGSLAPERHNTVQEICAKSLERRDAYFWARANEGQAINQVEAAKLREQTRADLRQVLNPLEVEEFVLRYSQNAFQLRQELRGLEPAPEEFRKIFRAIDPLEHQMQLEYGGIEAMSDKQRERHERLRDAAIRDALSPERYQAYLLTKDPLYRQAQMTAMNLGAPPKTILPIYQMTKATDTKRQKIMTDATLTQAEKMEAINEVNQEQQRTLQRIVADAASQR